ncbi:MAG TPA: efflux RND transporter periplasmic adaptor subunit, partial [Candidatus Nanopelagicales bacterium]|nr:efflux RND transporter periplasmic adaptor subunit [Candidatus Nanopelagicales bacterium]
MPATSRVTTPARPISARFRKAAFLALALAGVVGAVAVVRLRGAGARASEGPPLAAAAATTAKPAAGSPAQGPLPVDVVVVQPERLELSVPATGALIAHEAVDLVSELSRRLIKVRAKEGQPVKKGEVLFQLDAADLHAQSKRLEVQQRLARATVDRGDKLRSENLLSQQEWEQARARLDEIDAERAILGVTLSRTTIRAPFAGTLGLRRVSEGAWVTPQTVLATLQDTSRLKIDFTVPERFTGAVQIGQKFSFSVEGRGERLHGVIAAVEPQIQESSRSVLVRGVVENHAGLLPGTFAGVELPLSASDALMVPSIA